MDTPEILTVDDANILLRASFEYLKTHEVSNGTVIKNLTIEKHDRDVIRARHFEQKEQQLNLVECRKTFVESYKNLVDALYGQRKGTNIPLFLFCGNISLGKQSRKAYIDLLLAAEEYYLLSQTQAQQEQKAA